MCVVSTMKLAIIGSRSIEDNAWTLKTVDKAVKELNPTCILMGAARGPDNAVSHYAESHDIDLVRFLPYHLLDPVANFDSKHFWPAEPTKEMFGHWCSDPTTEYWPCGSPAQQVHHPPGMR